MSNLSTQEDAYREFTRLVHGIESNRKILQELTSKAKVHSEHQQILEMVIEVQKGLLNGMLGRNARGLNGEK